MSERHSDNDGSDIFWPGYVDAVTNLVLNLLFLLTILTVAVFMFARYLGRSSQVGAGKTPVVSTGQNAKKDASTLPVDPVAENIALKREIQRLNIQLARQMPQKMQSGVVEKTIEVTSRVSTPQNRIDKTLAVSDTDIVIRFTDEAVAFTPAEHTRLREALKPIAAQGKTSVTVEVPAGFSEAKRMGFYRAMAVRNLLIEMKMPKDSIDVSVREVKNNANASLVRVKAH